MTSLPENQPNQPSGHLPPPLNEGTEGITGFQLWTTKTQFTLRRLAGTWEIFRETKIGVLGLAVIIFFALLAAAHPVLMLTIWDEATYHPVTGYDLAQTEQPAPPSWQHPLGTDPLGRDVLSQLMSSTRSEFLLGVVAAIVTVTIATFVGAVSAYFGGVVDAFFMRLADLVVSLPGISLLIVLTALFDINLLGLGVVLGFPGGFGGVAIVLKSQALSITVKPYIEAARVAGGSRFHIIFVHVIPNLLPLSFLYMMFTVTAAIFSEAVLSFFGLLNIRMSWGIMIHTANTGGYLLRGTRYWWLIIPAGASITLLCSTFYLVGRALDEVFNPRLRRR